MARLLALLSPRKPLAVNCHATSLMIMFADVQWALYRPHF